MTKSRKSILYLLIALLACAFGLGLFACNRVSAEKEGEVILTFDSAGGSPVSSVRVPKGASVELDIPEKEGFAFDGWYAQKDGTGTGYRDTLIAPDVNTTYYAKWAEGVLLTLDPDGGTLARKTVWAKAGAPILAALTGLDVTPVKEGLLFGAWFLEDEEVTETTAMPASATTVKAHYKVEYTVELYLENLSGSSYLHDPMSADDVIGTAFVGETYAPEAPVLDHYTVTDTPTGKTPVSSLTLSEDPAQNIYRFYYTRNSYSVRFMPNAPAGAQVSGGIERVDGKYASFVKLPSEGFTLDGYRLAGWSRNMSGKPEYDAGETVEITGTMRFFAIWDRGFTDRYGSADLIFFPTSAAESAESVAILRRGDVEFRGKRGEDNSFTFTTDGGTMFEGRVYGTVFSYAQPELEGEYIFYEYRPLKEEAEEREYYDITRVLAIDPYLNATYRENSRTYTGAVAYNDEFGDYIFTDTAGTKTFHFLPRRGAQFKYPDGVFSVGSEEMGFYLDFNIIDRDQMIGYTTQSMLLALDGYTTASLMDAQNMMQYDGFYEVQGVYEMNDVTFYKVLVALNDLYGGLTGGTPGTVYNYIYTLPIDDPDYGGYVTADSYRKTYTGGEGTLTLDGFGIFADSAVYVDGDGNEITSGYRMENSLLDGMKIVFESGNKTYEFRVDPNTSTFAPYQTDPDRGEYTEYYFMDGNALRPPYLIVYGEGETRRAELWMPDLEDETALIRAASGTCTMKQIQASRFMDGIFTRTSVEPGYESLAPEYLHFYTSLVTSTRDFMSYDAYFVLERKFQGASEEDFSNEYQITGGGRIQTTSSVSAGGLGGLYFAPNGQVYEGQYGEEASEYFETVYATFEYGNDDGELITLYFKKADGGLTSIEYTEKSVYVIPEAGSSDASVGVRMLFLNSEDEAIYTENSGQSFQSGTYAAVDRTVFNEDIYALTVGGAEKFRFVLYQLESLSGLDLAALHVPASAGIYGSADGATLELDGYYRARFTDANNRATMGTYTRDGEQLNFLPDGAVDEDDALIFTLSEKTFRPIDWASSREWILLNNNYETINNLTIRFDGEGGVKVVRGSTSLGGGEQVVSEGRYRALDTVYEGWGLPEYMVSDISFGDGYPNGNYTVTFAINSEGTGACLVRNAGAYGVYADDDWNVIHLDGYGRGTIVTGDFTASGEYTIVSSNARFQFLALEIGDDSREAAGRIFYLRVLGNGKFDMTDYAALQGFYLADNMESIAFTEDGLVYLGANSGPYYVDGDAVTAFISENRTTVTYTMPAPTPNGASYSYRNKTYTRWDGKEMTLAGEIAYLNEAGQPIVGRENDKATLRFTPNGTTNAGLAAIFLLGETQEETDGFTLTMYGQDGFAPTVTYAMNVYPIAFANGSFTVTAGFNSVEYLDHNERFYDESDGVTPRGGKIYKSTIGFGPNVGEVEYSGVFNYLYDADHTEPIIFAGVKEEDILCVGTVPSYGNRMELVFEFEGTMYAIDYYEYYQGGNYFYNYGLYTYEESEADGYTVRVKSLAYTHFSTAPGYVPSSSHSKDTVGNTVTEKDSSYRNFAVGQPIAATLIKDGEAMVAYDTGYMASGYGKGVWIVDKESVIEDGTRDTCAWGTGYLVTFDFAADGHTMSAVHVKQYDFVQVVNYMECLVNFFVDEDGKAQIVGYGDFNESFGRYDWATNPHDAAYDADGKTFTFQSTTVLVETEKVTHGSDAPVETRTVTTTVTSYTITFEEGDRKTFEEGPIESGRTYTVTMEKSSEITKS